MKNFTSYTIMLIAFFLMYNHCSFSQGTSYSPFPEKYGRWLIKRGGPYGDGEVEKWNLTLYETAGDTILGGFTYKKVIATDELQNISPGPKDIWSYNLGVKHLSFAYRNDIPHKKVYILTDANMVINGKLTTEYLWYDFDSTKVGDTLKSTYSLVLVSQVEYNRIKVAKTDSTFICGSYHKRCNFYCGGNFGTDDLIEGVGFHDNFIKTHAECLFEPRYLYTTYFSCSPTNVFDEGKLVPVVSIFPNPVFNTLQIKWPEQDKNALLRYSIMDCLGKVIFQGEDTPEFIDVSGLTKGLYFLTVSDRAGTYYKNKFIKQE
jgi:hypothetical protein